MRFPGVALLIGAVVVGLWAQNAEKPLSNEDVEAMLASGLPESTILMKIQIAASRGMIDFNASPGALVALKQAGASERVLNAVQWAEPFGGAWRTALLMGQLQQEENQAAPGLPDTAGVYVKAPAGWELLGSFVFWAPQFADTAWMHGSHEFSVPVPADQSVVHTGTQPAFYVRQPTTGASWRIIPVSSHRDRHWLDMKRRGEWDHVVSDPVYAAPGLHEKHLAGSIFLVWPEAALPPGGYQLCTAVVGGAGLNLCYAFGVVR